MRILIAPSPEEFCRLSAWTIARQIMARPRSVVGFATGRTTTGIHAALAEIYRQYPFDTSCMTALGMDEITGVPRDYAGACYDMLLKQVVEPLNIPLENYLMPPTCAPDLKKECELFGRAIRNRGGIDFQELGIGENGHIGFNQPGAPFDSTVTLGEMDDRLSRRIHRETGIPMETHLGGITLGIKDIMQARHIMLCANGPGKRDIVEAALLGPVTPQVPASVLQLHPNLDVILDPDAGQKIAPRLPSVL